MPVHSPDSKRVLACALLLGCISAFTAAAQEETPATLSLVKGSTKPNNTKPAEISYVSDGYGSASHSIQAALMSREFSPFIIPGTVATGLAFAAGISKDTVVKKPSDSRSFAANLGALWFQTHRLRTVGIFALEDDNQNDNRGNQLRFDTELDSPLLAVGRDAGDAGQFGWRLQLYPSLGAYERRITSSKDEKKVPEGHYGGPYGGLRLLGTFGYVTSEVKWRERVGVDISLYRIRDSWVSSAYTSETHNFATGTISYLLHDYSAKQKSVWKPSIGLTRLVGTDRFNNLPKKAENKLALQISYGL
jgi:hypothetical protein